MVGFSNVTCAESDKAGFPTSRSGLHDIGNLFAPADSGVEHQHRRQIVGSSVTANGVTRAFISGPGGTGAPKLVSIASSA
ncbi:MAG: hypothetical protein M3083_08440 [Actinomycetota bacterium]|nr:hypothetical protein [Actinomycetota bacterium]